jgi:hypothetical protein
MIVEQPTIRTSVEKHILEQIEGDAVNQKAVSGGASQQQR